MKTLQAFLIYEEFILYVIISGIPAIYTASNKEFLGTFPLKMSGPHSLLRVNDHFHDHMKKYTQNKY
jgi:hypothetical protein